MAATISAGLRSRSHEESDS